MACEARLVVTDATGDRMLSAAGEMNERRGLTWLVRLGRRRFLLLDITGSLLTGVAAFVLCAIMCTVLRDEVPAVVLGAVLLNVIFVIARLAGIMYALPVGVVALQAFDWYYLPPVRTLDAATALLLALFLVMSVTVAAVTVEAGRRRADSERELRVLAGIQESLRRLAMLVAAAEPPEAVFAAVIKEVLRHFGSGTARMIRFESDGTATLVANEGTMGPHVLVGRPWEGYPPTGLTATVRRTGQACRVDDYAAIPGGEAFLREGLRSAVALPVHVNGRLWGFVAVGSGDGPLPPDTEVRMADFTNLVATAVANAQSRADLITSRARLVTAADETRRRIERDLHDGAQQHLVSLALNLRSAAIDPTASQQMRSEIDRIAGALVEVTNELREISRGIHPAILSESGLRPALRALARRSAVAVEVNVEIDGRMPESVEVAAYYVVSEMLTNAAKYADATRVEVNAERADGRLLLSVRDDGVGGANPAQGSGLVGLQDRVEALGGRLTLASPPGDGTTISCEMPLTWPSSRS